MATEIEKAHELIVGIRVGLRAAFEESSEVVETRKRLDQVQQALYSAKTAFDKAVRATAFYKQFQAMGGAIEISPPAGSLDYGSLRVRPETYGSWGIEQIETKSAPSYSAPIDPKTLNALITGKLLSAEEKRALLKSQGVDLDARSKAEGK